MLPNTLHQHHHLQEDDSSGILQSLQSTAPEPPSPNTLDKHFVFPLEKLPRNTSYPLSMPVHESHIAKTRVAAPIERLPVEIFDQIIPYLAVETPTNGYTPRNRDLASCLLVSRTFYNMTLSTLYARVTFPHSSIFSKFLAHITKYPELGQLVRRLDFAQFTAVGLGRTRKAQFEINNLTQETLLRCLSLTPRLREFLAVESMDMDVNAAVMEKLFFDLPMLQAVDFCGSGITSSFVKDMTAVLSSNNPRMPDVIGLKRVGFHGCNILPPSVFASLVPRLGNVTHLDLTHTAVTDGTLHALPHTARLTHLSLSKCNRLRGPAVVDFIVNHPALKNLIYLNLHFDTSRYRLLSVADVDELLPRLPKSLRSLNLSGAKINSSHIPELRRLAEHLEELSIGGADLTLTQINVLFEKGEEDEQRLRGGPRQSTLRYLDLTGVASVTPVGIILAGSNESLLRRDTFPLQVLELSEKVTDGLKERSVSGNRMGWVVKSDSRRQWYVRRSPGVAAGGDQLAKAIGEDDGSRPWKMGGKWWGARKIGMAEAEPTGLYGYYSYGK
ncbi:hypothetical protein BZA05DRAFT_451260 [Tricharina praecox]|uniref:uncharacterized protein n=1 Tax=Tricharina praecox TaxID=43433 RepID=UPI00221F8C9D|nr:uncharacterized protein BZA05DRAFT_451260 [Tricharina praecox]KAI5859135.1 hypothetical protein BZA05DRAFT_451260 [Tricharina praecox]